jgi:glycosyltransferase involved in cell wall biosynthesis
MKSDAYRGRRLAEEPAVPTPSHAGGSSGRVRVLVIAPQPFFQVRGTPIAVRMVVERLVGRGYSVELLTLPGGEDVSIPGCRITRLPPLRILRGIRPGFSLRKLVADLLLLGSAWRFARGGRVDLVHGVEEGALIALVVKRVFGIPYVYDMDSSLVEQLCDRFPALRGLRRMLRGVERSLIRESIGVMTVCRALEDLAQTAAPGKTMVRIEDPSLLPTYCSTDGATVERLRDVTGGARPIALYVGNLEPYQGIDLLLEGFQHAAAAVPTAALVVIGGAPGDIGAYARRAGELGLASRVHFLGPRPLAHLAAYLSQADVVVSPRIAGTNTPMKVFSYLDSGVPLLATRLLTHTQVLDDTIALLVDPTPEAVGAGLARLFGDPPLRRALAEAARQRMQGELGPEAYRRKFDGFYDRIEQQLAASMRAPLLARLPG